MTISLKLYDGDTLQVILVGSQVLRLAADGWATTSIEPGSSRAWETISLISSPTADDDLIRAEIVELERLLEQAEKFNTNPYKSNAVHLYWASEGETEKMALVYGGKISIPTNNTIGPMMGKDHLRLILTLQRGPWESISSSQMSVTQLSTYGGDYTTPWDHGTVDGRIVKTTIEGYNALTAGLHEIWVGIRDINQGASHTNMDAVRDISSTVGTDTTHLTGQSGAYNGSLIRCTFATVETMTQRGLCSFAAVSDANAPYYVGKYLAIIRAKLSTTGIVGIQLGYGYGSNRSLNEIVYIEDSTSWKLYPAGIINLPPMGYRSTIQDPELIKNFIIWIYEERLSGACSLDIDSICLVPADHLAYARGANVNYNALEADNPLIFFVYENGEMAAVAYTGDTPSESVEYSLNNWVLPQDGGYIVFCGQAENAHTLSEVITFTLLARPRWGSVRDD